jgi:hypothetical protein
MALKINPTSILKRGILKRDSSLSSFHDVEPPVSDESREKRSVRLNVTGNQAVDHKFNNEFPPLNEMVRKCIAFVPPLRWSGSHLMAA